MVEDDAIKIYVYNFSGRHLWFHVCNDLLTLAVPKHITERSIGTNLPLEETSEVRDLFLKPFEAEWYEKYKIALIKRASNSSQTEIHKLLSRKQVRGW